MHQSQYDGTCIRLYRIDVPIGKQHVQVYRFLKVYAHAAPSLYPLKPFLYTHRMCESLRIRGVACDVWLEENRNPVPIKHIGKTRDVVLVRMRCDDDINRPI